MAPRGRGLVIQGQSTQDTNTVRFCFNALRTSSTLNIHCLVVYFFFDFLVILLQAVMQELLYFPFAIRSPSPPFLAQPCPTISRPIEIGLSSLLCALGHRRGKVRQSLAPLELGVLDDSCFMG